MEKTQPAVDAYNKADSIKNLADGNKYIKSREFRDLFKNKPLINILNMHGFVLQNAKTAIFVGDTENQLHCGNSLYNFKFGNGFVIFRRIMTPMEEHLGGYLHESPEVFRVFNINTGKELFSRDEISQAIRAVENIRTAKRPNI